VHTLALACLVGCLAFPAAFSAELQFGADPVPPTWSQRPGQSPMPNVRNPQAGETAQERMEREQRAKNNEKRQAQAVADAARLAQLSKELQEELEHAGAATLSAGSFKKADQIIKLAKSVKDKMRPL
jgi:hypothetical protein